MCMHLCIMLAITLDTFFPLSHMYMCSILFFIDMARVYLMSTVQHAKPPVLIAVFYFKVWTRVAGTGDSQMSNNILGDFNWTTRSRLGSCDG